MSRSYTTRTRPVKTTKPTSQSTPTGMDQEESEEFDRPERMDVSPSHRIERREGYSVIRPNETKRQHMQRIAAEEEKQHEDYKRANQPHYSCGGTVGSVSAADGQQNLPAIGGDRPFIGREPTPQEKARKYRMEKKQREEQEMEEMRLKQRQKAIDNEQRERQRNEKLDADKKRKHEEFLAKLEGKQPSVTGEPQVATRRVNTGVNDYNDFDAAVLELKGMFPDISGKVLETLLKESGNDVDAVVQLLS